MFETKRAVPWSGKRYWIDGLGILFFNDGTTVPTFEEGGELCVEIEWVLGKRKYLVSVISLVSFSFLSVPEDLLDEIIPLYRDGSKTNLSPQNLIYKFKSGKIEVPNFPGFYFIPFYVDYAINQKGDLINISTGKIKSWSIIKPDVAKNQTGGYRYSRVINDLGFSKTLFQHRALCYVFKDYGSDVLDLVVNHIDGNPLNNDIENLELVSYQRNNTHAVEIGLRGDNKPVLSRNLITGEIKRFNSINECGRHYGEPRAGFVSHRLKYGREKLFSDMLQFKYDDGSPWFELDLNKEKIYRAGIPGEILARNVFTGTIVRFTGSENGFSFTGVKGATILSHVRESKDIPMNGWNFRWSQEIVLWPNHSEKHLRVYSKFPVYPPDGVDVFNIETNEELFFESVAVACNRLSVSKDLLLRHMRENKPILGKYKATFFELRKNLGHPIEQSIDKKLSNCWDIPLN